MCGICGVSPARDVSVVTRMNRALRHRGPDDEGIHIDCEAGLALGARRLSVIDVEGGHQPLSNEDGTVWAVLNGEIYNHPALRCHLRRRGHRLTTRTDTEVLVHLYEEYNEDFVHALEGMFALALWDSRRRRLVLARDRFGEKPLFYTERAGMFAFASELTALCCALNPSPDVDPIAVDAFFVMGYVPGPRSILRDVHQLQPGHMLTWGPSAPAKLRRYWTPPAAPAAGPTRIRDLVAETRLLLEAAVRSRMIADVPLGVLLSGGVDSALISTIAARVSASTIKTFTVGYDVGSVDESLAAEQIARTIDTQHHRVVLTCEEVAVRAPRVLAALDQPLADQAVVALHCLAEEARRHVTVAIGGEGADEIFAGYPRYGWMALTERLHQVAPSDLVARFEHRRTAWPFDGHVSWHLRGFVEPSLGPRNLDWVTTGRLRARYSLYGPALLAQLIAEPTQSDFGMRLPEGDGDVISRLMRLDQLTWLPDDVLAKADRASMLASLEMRTPYLERALAEFAASVPGAVHHARGGKQLLRAVLNEDLPGVSGRRGPGGRRRKIAFRVPADQWLRVSLAEPLYAQLKGPLYAEHWFDRRAVARLIDDHMSGRRNLASVLWPLFALGLWLERYRNRHA